MMSEQITPEMLSAYVDGELTPAENAAVERRLAESLPLREQLAGLQDVSQQVRMLPRPFAPAEFRTEILDLIDRNSPSFTLSGKRSGPRRWFRSIAAWGAAAVAASLLVMASWTLAPRAELAKNVGEREEIAFAPVQPTVRPLEPAAVPMPAPITSTAPSISEFSDQPVARGQLSEMAASVPELSEQQSVQSEPVPVVNVSKEEIRRRIDEMDHQPQRGNSIKVPGSLKSGEEETPIVVVFTVVDVMQAMNQMQVLVQQQQVRSQDNRVVTLKQDQSVGSPLTAVTLELEMDGPEMAAVLNSVAAFDAVMYVENGVELTPRDKEMLGTAPAEVKQSEKFVVSGKGQDSSVQLKRGKPEITGGAQRQFDFQQLADQAALDALNPPLRRAMSASPAKDNAKPGSNSLTKSAPQQPEVASESAAAMTLSSQMQGGAKAGRSGKEASGDTASQPGGEGWEGIPRFRAFILLKQQSPEAISPK